MPAAGHRSAHGIDTTLLNALYWESDKCATVTQLLSSLGRTLHRAAALELKRVCQQVHDLRGAMLAFADLFPLHPESVYYFLNHLDMVLPSISKTLDDIQILCPGHRRLDDAGWDHLLDTMFDESNQKLELEARFKLYTKFFDNLFLGLIQSPKFDWRKAEGLRVQMMDLREDSGMPLPQELSTVFYPLNELPAARVRRQSFIEHWVIETVDRRPEVASAFEEGCLSNSFGPYTHWNRTGISDKSKFLFRRGFDNDALSVTVLIDRINRLPYVMLRTLLENVPLYECRPLADLRIRRSETKLHLSRWSPSQEGFIHWAVLHFQFFEELVVIQCTLLSLKAQTSMAAKAISHDEAVFRDDTRIWETDIKDNGVRHKLAIYRDDLTGTKRLYACVANGERYQAYTPAWTIFFSNRKAKPQMECLGDYKLIIYDTSLYTFGDRYLTSKHNPRCFEITFRHRQDNRQLKHIFDGSCRIL
ncbi:Peptidase C48, SUMO/Sentrin/Ubl1 [Akanthomyces lecanii RCEF 1005]|uniref:Peptidase C48, SUMO/Sentrin/Ubl1 n=1 Tax=Akanthomyces lecanii RCEF 1005 TaxID=1081108 RepID=A0A168HMN7_CORDF|nr:Peptidase C48, SUMO/Sentrin/Ubl1 [Akanthomyces lecanii RCEF 1005]